MITERGAFCLITVTRLNLYGYKIGCGLHIPIFPRPPPPTPSTDAATVSAWNSVLKTGAFLSFL